MASNVITPNILKNGAYDQVYRMPLAEIIYKELWLPADYGFGVPCGEDCIYHYRCIETTFVDRWLHIMDACREAPRYKIIFKSIKLNGFVYPLAAKVGEDNKHIALMDGHNRLTAAFDQKHKYIPVFIANPAYKVEDLVATDSNYWPGGQMDSFFSRLDNDPAAC